MKQSWMRVAQPVLVAVVVGTVVWVNAGSLTPPVGPVAPTMKTLSEVEPRIAVGAATTPGDANSVFRISTPGSYYAAADLEGEPGKYGIEVEASNVTLDLNGFSLIGTAPTSLDGVRATGALENITVRNGVIRDFGGAGVNLVSTRSFRIEGISALNNGVTSSGSGIVGGENGVVDRCLASGNVADGIAALGGVVISRSSSSQNGVDGFRCNNACLITECTAKLNTTSGIHAGSSTIKGCTAFQNGIGIEGADSLIAECSASVNVGAGISVLQNCQVYGNDCTFNGSGIFVTSGAGNNRLESNNLTANTQGLVVQSTGNLILRNSARGNTTNNYNVFSGNVGFYVSATTTSAVAGSSGGTTIGTTDPWANLSY